jgi:hypothetical protein
LTSANDAVKQPGNRRFAKAIDTVVPAPHSLFLFDVRRAASV